MTDVRSVESKKVLDRIIKLFRLGEAGRNDSEAETMAALSKAKQLMMEYDISMAEVDAAAGADQRDTIRIEVETVVAYTIKGSFASYDAAIAAAVDAICGTKNFTQQYPGGIRSRIFIGATADVAVASALFMILLTGMRRQARLRLGGGWSGSHSSYSNAYSLRVYHRALELAQTKAAPEHAATYALVVRSKETAIAEYSAQLNLHTGRKRTFQMRDGYAARLGDADGSQVDLTARNRLSTSHLQTR